MDCIIVYCTIYIEDFSTWIFIPTATKLFEFGEFYPNEMLERSEYSQHNFDLQINLKRGCKDKLMEANMVFLLEYRIHYPRVGAANEWWSWLGSLGTAHLHKFLQTINYPSHNVSLIYLLGKLPDLVNETNQFPHTRTTSQNNFESSKYFLMSPQSTSRFSRLDDDDDDGGGDDDDDQRCMLTTGCWRTDHCSPDQSETSVQPPHSTTSLHSSSKYQSRTATIRWCTHC